MINYEISKLNNEVHLVRFGIIRTNDVLRMIMAISFLFRIYRDKIVYADAVRTDGSEQESIVYYNRHKLKIPNLMEDL